MKPQKAFLSSDKRLYLIPAFQEEAKLSYSCPTLLHALPVHLLNLYIFLFTT